MAIDGITWLECPKCGLKEWLNVRTALPLGGCPKCGTARIAVNDYGLPMIVWSNFGDLTNWDVDPSAGSVDLSDVDWKIPEQ